MFNIKFLIVFSLFYSNITGAKTYLVITQFLFLNLSKIDKFIYIKY